MSRVVGSSLRTSRSAPVEQIAPLAATWVALGATLLVCVCSGPPAAIRFRHGCEARRNEGTIRYNAESFVWLVATR